MGAASVLGSTERLYFNNLHMGWVMGAVCVWDEWGLLLPLFGWREIA